MTSTVDRPAPAERVGDGPRMRPLVLVLALTLALLLGVVVGWVVKGDPNDGVEVTLVSADGGDLTSEQREMQVMLERYIDELRNGDYEAAESWFFNDGGIRVLDGFDVPYGEFGTMLPGAPWLIDEVLDPALVYEDRIIFLHRDTEGLLRSNDVRFGDFDKGEFHIEEHRITD